MSSHCLLLPLFFPPEVAQFFFVDTTPFVVRNWIRPGRRHYDWRGVTPRDAYIANLLKVRTTTK